MPLQKARKRAKDIEAEVLARNNISKEFTNKEVYLLLLDQIDKKLDAHLKSAEHCLNTYLPIVMKHTEILDHIAKELPDKGFCTKVDKIYSDMYPEKEESLPDRVKTLWYDRALLKWVLGTSVGALIISVIGLATRYLFPAS